MLKGVNDSDADARRLVKLIAGIPAKINLIPFNEWPGAPYERSDWERIEAFADIVYKAGYASPIRTPRGEDIMAACGQLKSATERGRKSRAEIAADFSDDADRNCPVTAETLLAFRICDLSQGVGPKGGRIYEASYHGGM
jgi:hypothetical protein